jgi:hypothetical protein
MILYLFYNHKILKRYDKPMKMMIGILSLLVICFATDIKEWHKKQITQEMLW